MSVRPSRLGHIGLVVQDLSRMVDFYETVMGMQVSDRMSFPADSPFDEGAWLRINTDHHVISMFTLRDPPGHDASGDRREPRPGVHHLGYEAATFEDLRRTLHFAREHEIPIQGMHGGGPGCQLRIYLWDPEDNMIELYFAMDRIGWDGAARPYPPVEQVDFESFDIDSWLRWKGPEFDPDAGRARVAGAQPA